MPVQDQLKLNHHFNFDQVNQQNWGKKIYDQIPWIIYKKNDAFVYHLISRKNKNRKDTLLIAFIDNEHTIADIFWSPEYKNHYLEGNLDSLTGFPSDQVLLANLLAFKQGCFFHANGVLFNKQGLLFMGQSGYGKSTIAKMFNTPGGNILCDDRIIVR
ncbi:MAG: hypothetical protein GY729_11530, partial [Desulfobacteraceae bacterium]|nr:hypothetical protein [Desulfobacteraceae bacterium]